MVLIEVKNIEEITPFQFNKDYFKKRMDDWLVFERIENIQK